jgi:hypothetical protein
MPSFRRDILFPYSAMKMEILCVSETLASPGESTRRQNPKEHHRHQCKLRLNVYPETVWHFLLTTLYLHFPLSLTRQRFLCSSSTFKPLRSVSRESVPAVPSWCAQQSSCVQFSFRTIFRKSKLFMGGICTLDFETQEWDFVSFLVCFAVFDMYYCFGFLFCFDFHCCYWSIGQFSWAVPTEIGTNLYRPISISVCYIFLLGMCFLLIRICSLILQFWVCA